MHFFKYHPLKQRLRERSLTDREALPYYILYVAATTVTVALPAERELNTWDAVVAAGTVGCVVAGTLYCFAKNGGRVGCDFIQKSIVLGWVVLCRCFLPLLLFAVAVFAVASEFGISGRATSCVNVLFAVISSTAYYQRLGRHLKDTRRDPGDPSAAGDPGGSHATEPADSPQES